MLGQAGNCLETTMAAEDACKHTHTEGGNYMFAYTGTLARSANGAKRGRWDSTPATISEDRSTEGTVVQKSGCVVGEENKTKSRTGCLGKKNHTMQFKNAEISHKGKRS